MIVVDTTILTYAVGADHPLREPSLRILRAATAGAVHATTTVEVIQEFVHVRSRRHPRRNAIRAARDHAEILAPLLVSTADALQEALRLYERHSRLDAFDALLAATALLHDAEALVSADRGFSGIRGLRYVDLASPALDDLIA